MTRDEGRRHQFLKYREVLHFTLGVGDNCAILDFSQRHLTGHSWTYLRNFWFCRIFFHAKLPPATAKTLWMLKNLM